MRKTSSTNAKVSAPVVAQASAFATVLAGSASKQLVVGPVPTGYARSLAIAVSTTAAATVYVRSFFASRTIVLDDAGTAVNNTTAAVAYTGPIGEETEIMVLTAGANTVSAALIARS